MRGQDQPDPPKVSIVITTCAMPERAARCVASALACDPPPHEVIVVENRPMESGTAALLGERFQGERRVKCVMERRRGLSRARNSGLQAASSEIVMFTDDDVVIDRGWTGAVAQAFARRPEVMCVTGPILPLELRTSAQRTFEAFAPLDKGGEPRLYRLASPPRGDALFPYAPGRLGSGANVSLRRGFARSIGGFDVALGAGTLASGGEDLDLFVRVLRSGAQLAYEPQAIVRHQHVSTMGELEQRALRYGIGLSAMMTKQLMDAGQRREILRRVPRGLAHLLSPSSQKNASKGPGYPRRLDLLEWLGLALGPLAYLGSALLASVQGRRR